MDITLSNYEPFDCTKWFVRGARIEKTDCTIFHLCKKICHIALAILCIVPALILDSVLTLVSASYPKHTYPILDCPYPYSLLGAGDTQFFKTGIREALRFIPWETQRVYIDLMKNDGEPLVGEAPISIYQWSAACLLVHYLRTRGLFERVETLFPRNVEESVGTLWVEYQWLFRKERAEALLKAVAPENGATDFSNQIHAVALGLTQQLKFKEIFPSVAQSFS